MARNLVELFERFSTEQSRKDREVVEVRIRQKRGIGRAKVALPGCDQEVLAREPTPIACGASAQAVVNRSTGATTILPGPRSEAGQPVRILKKRRALEVPNPFIKTAQFLIYTRDVTDLEATAYTIDGEEIQGVGVTITVDGIGTTTYPEVADAVGEGTRIIRDTSTEDLVSVDLLGPAPAHEGGVKYTYTPTPPWIVTHGQKIGTEVFWFEWDPQTSSSTTSVRLRKSSSIKLTSPTTVHTATVTSPLTTPDWVDARGPDFTDDEAGVWIAASAGEAFLWERIKIPLVGGGSTQRATGDGSDTIDETIRAGHPATNSQSITQQTNVTLPVEGTAYPSVTWDGDPENDIVAWASVGDVVDIAPDPTDGFFWVLKKSADRIERYNDAGVLQSTITLDTVPDTPIGLHYLATTFDIDTTPAEE